ncbi:MAG: Veg family protein [Coprococcus sp.]
MQQRDIINVRRAVDANIGRRVRVKANKGRHKYSIAEGVIQESYPSIFTVRLSADGDSSERVVSYSYTDVLTRDVQLVICKS